MSQKEITYYCKLCGEFEGTSTNVKRHITKSQDETHRGKKSSWNYIGEFTGENPDKETVETSNNTGTYKGPAKGIDMSMSHITERSTTGTEESPIVVAMDSDTLFELIRTADKEVAKSLFEQLQERPNSNE